MLNLNYNINASNLERARFTEQENEAFRQFQIQYIIVPAGGGAAAGNNQYDSGSIPKVGIAGNGGIIASGSYCVQPLTSYPIVIGKGGAGGLRGTLPSFTGSNGGDSSFYDIIALGGEGGKSQTYITSSTFAGSGATTSASIADGGSGSQWTYNLPGCLPDPFNPGCHGGELISSSYYSGGGAGIVVSGSIPTLEIEYIVVGGGGAGVNNQDTCNGGATFGGGGGAAITGSFVCEPIVKTYPIIVGAGGIGKYACDPGTGSASGQSSAFGTKAQGGQSGNSGTVSGGNSGTGSWGLTTPFLGAVSASGAGGAGAAGNGDSVKASTPLGTWKDGNGGAGLQWVDGRYYAGGGPGGTQTATDFQGQWGITTELIPSTNFYAGRGGGGIPGNAYNVQSNGNSGSVVIRYPGTGSKATGGIIQYSGSYTYHIFTASGEFTLNESTSSLFTSGLPGVGSGNAFFSPSGSLTPIPFTGGGAAATYYNQNGVSGSDGFVAIRYEGLPLADGGTIVITDHYTYHLFSSSGDFYVIGQETNPNINPCP